MCRESPSNGSGAGRTRRPVSRPDPLPEQNRIAPMLAPTSSAVPLPGALRNPGIRRIPGQSRYFGSATIPVACMQARPPVCHMSSVIQRRSGGAAGARARRETLAGGLEERPAPKCAEGAVGSSLCDHVKGSRMAWPLCVSGDSPGVSRASRARRAIHRVAAPPEIRPCRMHLGDNLQAPARARRAARAFEHFTQGPARPYESPAAGRGRHAVDGQVVTGTRYVTIRRSQSDCVRLVVKRDEIAAPRWHPPRLARIDAIRPGPFMRRWRVRLASSRETAERATPSALPSPPRLSAAAVPRNAPMSNTTSPGLLGAQQSKRTLVFAQTPHV